MKTRKQQQPEARATLNGPAVASSSKMKKRSAPPKTRQLTNGSAPGEPAIEQVVARLEPADRVVAERIISELEKHLGSREAARRWLESPAPEFGTTPLADLAAGRAKIVLAVIESRWGPSPTYA